MRKLSLIKKVYQRIIELKIISLIYLNIFLKKHKKNGYK